MLLFTNDDDDDGDDADAVCDDEDDVDEKNGLIQVAERHHGNQIYGIHTCTSSPGCRPRACARTTSVCFKGETKRTTAIRRDVQNHYEP